MEQNISSEPDPLIALDEEISKIRSEIHNLTKRRRVLSASLLSSNAAQKALRSQSASGPDPSLGPVILSTEKHAQSNHYRAVFSTTSFPFKDPSPHADSPNLLGVRIDICRRGGRYSEPYYVLLKRVNSDRKLLRVHKHTIPIFIPLQQLEGKYLSVPEADLELEENTKAQKPGKQDLQRFVRELRRELVAWHLRRDAAVWLQEELGLGKSRREEGSLKPEPLALKLGISSVSSTSLETRCIRFEWRDGRVGRVYLSNRGFIDRAVVVSDLGRDKATENLFLRGDGRIEAVVQRLIDANSID